MSTQFFARLAVGVQNLDSVTADHRANNAPGPETEPLGSLEVSNGVTTLPFSLIFQLGLETLGRTIEIASSDNLLKHRKCSTIGFRVEIAEIIELFYLLTFGQGSRSVNTRLVVRAGLQGDSGSSQEKYTFEIHKILLYKSEVNDIKIF